ncbi:hypothetical protein IV203_032994 [Nitzschia inconspicua]|uniref:Uncharacterized protein n=1 Tax=Nitzschia inconspicua TaxID=303405 RepID=A0A9K3PFG4_9STRA|nr:hypothetical protein IV203_032994 [Nitzschia inconspicua]
MIGHQMAMFAFYIWRHLRGPYLLVAMPFPLPVTRERPADALPIEVALETTATMTGFLPNLHREKKRTRGRAREPKEYPTCGLLGYVQTQLIRRFTTQPKIVQEVAQE